LSRIKYSASLLFIINNCVTHCLQAVLPDVEQRSETLKKQKEEAQSAWTLALAASQPPPPTPKIGDAAEGLPAAITTENANGDIVDASTSVGASPDSSPASAAEAVVTEAKPQELLDLEEACKAADEEKRTQQR